MGRLAEAEAGLPAGFCETGALAALVGDEAGAADLVAAVATGFLLVDFVLATAFCGDAFFAGATAFLVAAAFLAAGTLAGLEAALLTGAAFLAVTFLAADFAGAAFFAGTAFFTAAFLAGALAVFAADFAAGFLAATLFAAGLAVFLVALAAFLADFLTATSGVSSRFPCDGKARCYTLPGQLQQPLQPSRHGSGATERPVQPVVHVRATPTGRS